MVLIYRQKSQGFSNLTDFFCKSNPKLNAQIAGDMLMEYALAANHPEESITIITLGKRPLEEAVNLVVKEMDEQKKHLQKELRKQLILNYGLKKHEKPDYTKYSVTKFHKKLVETYCSYRINFVRSFCEDQATTLFFYRFPHLKTEKQDYPFVIGINDVTIKPEFESEGDIIILKDEPGICKTKQTLKKELVKN